ncbi:MAG: sigma-70 family RNA polymerase sigma factor, partial [Acidobacteria bacterium]|nr:sigma-70 family RNA polymerase sigma factor [Acidobacteriota bacterium]
EDAAPGAGEDLAVARRAAGGDHQAFELLVRRHTEAVWRLAYSSLHERAAAEDAVQETFVKAYRALGGFRGESSVRTWLLAIAHRTCLDQIRRARPEVASLDEARGVRARSVDAATRVALQVAVEALPEEERKAFVLVDSLGFSREEAAAILEVPASTLKSRLARAHERLVEAIGERGERGRQGR